MTKRHRIRKGANSEPPHRVSCRGRRDWQPGERVRVRGKPIGLVSPPGTGTVVGPDEWDGYYLVSLDVPAQHWEEPEPLPVIREAGDNLLPADWPKRKRPASAGGAFYIPAHAVNRSHPKS